jgi:peptidoglycan-associated lipoprotein
MGNVMPRIKPRAAVVVGGLVAAALLSQGCATTARRPLVSDTRCADFNFQVYFEEQSAVVPRAARRVIADAARQVKGCPTATVDVVGLADFRGPPVANLALSRQRAEAVAAALGKTGFPAPGFSVQGVGAAGSVNAQGAIEPLRRRADVYVRFSKR